jgi:hypothetical protein
MSASQLTHRIDWQRLVLELRRAGLKSHLIAKHAMVSRPSIAYYGQGICTPRHPTGELLIGLWCETMHKAREELPTERQIFVEETVSTLHSVRKLTA